METLQSHHRVALLLVVPLLGALVADTAVRVTTGESTFVTDDSVGPAILGQVVSAFLGLALLALFWVLRREAGRFTVAGRVARGCRRVLLVALPVLAAGLAVAGPALRSLGVESGPLYDASGLAALVGLLVCVVAAIVLGLSQLRRNTLGLGGQLLMLIVPAMLVTGGLALSEPDLASPVLLTAAMLGGLATLGVGAHGHRGAPVVGPRTS
jgi:hypothetical protein